MGTQEGAQRQLGTQPLGLGQVGELDNKKQGRRPGCFLNPKAMQPNSHMKTGLQSAQYSRTNCPDLAGLALKQHLENRCL